MPEPIRPGLAGLDSRRIAVAIVSVVLDRAMRDTHRLHLVVRTVENGQNENEARAGAVAQSDLFHAAWVLAEWATLGRGQAAEIPAFLRQVRADLDGISVTEASTRGSLDLSTVPEVALAAAGARLARVEGRTMSAVELATFASIGEHSVRAATKAGTLRPVASGVSGPGSVVRRRTAKRPVVRLQS